MRSRPSHLGAAVALSAAAIAGGLLATTVSGSDAAETARQALPAEKRSISAAVKRSPIAGLRGVRAKYNVKNARVSTKSPYWATAQVVPKPAHAAIFQGGYAVLVRLSDPLQRVGPWVVVDAGSSGVGCRIAPISVLRDLGVASECAREDRL
jgi:hypothetical protein